MGLLDGGPFKQYSAFGMDPKEMQRKALFNTIAQLGIGLLSGKNWGQGIGQGLLSAQQAGQQAQEDAMRQALFQKEMQPAPPEYKEIGGRLVKIESGKDPSVALGPFKDAPKLVKRLLPDGSEGFVWDYGGMVGPVTPGVPAGEGPAQSSITTQPLPPGASPRGVRNNNPGNIKQTDIAWSGEVPGTDKTFETFDAPENGMAATMKNMLTYSKEHGLNTIQGIVNRWAPGSENNTSAYMAAVSKMTGIPVDQPLDLNDPETLKKMAKAITMFENGGQPYGDEVYDKAVQLAMGGEAQPNAVAPLKPPTPPDPRQFYKPDEFTGQSVFDRKAYETAQKDFQMQAESYRLQKTNDPKEYQAKAGSYLAVAENANQTLTKLESVLTSSQYFLPEGGMAGAVANYFKTPEYRMARDAGMAFTEQFYRLLTGAAAPVAEWQRIEERLVPIPGDDDKTIAAKRIRRDLVVLSLRNAAGQPGKHLSTDEARAQLDQILSSAQLPGEKAKEEAAPTELYFDKNGNQVQGP